MFTLALDRPPTTIILGAALRDVCTFHRWLAHAGLVVDPRNRRSSNDSLGEVFGFERALVIYMRYGILRCAVAHDTTVNPATAAVVLPATCILFIALLLGGADALVIETSIRLVRGDIHLIAMTIGRIRSAE